MSCFEVHIDWKDVSSYVIYDSLPSIKLQCEGQSIWDYRTNTVSVSMKDQVFPVLNVSPDKIEQLHNKRMEIKYYGNTIFGGAVETVSYDYKSKILTIHAGDVLRAISQLPPYLIGEVREFKTQNVRTGDTPYEMMDRLFNNQKLNLDQSGFDFNMERYIVDLSDFTDYRSYVYQLMTFRDNIYGVFALTYATNTLIYIPESIVSKTPTGCFGYVVSNDQILNQNALPVFFQGDNYVIPKTELNDDIVCLLKENTGADDISELNITSAIRRPYGTYITFTKGTQFYIVVITESSIDRFIYNYDEKATSGDVLRDLAMLTNGIVAFNPGMQGRFQGILTLQSRDRGTYLADVNPEYVLDFSVETIKNDIDDLELPDNYIIPPQVRQSIVNNYRDMLNGVFKRSTISVIWNKLLNTSGKLELNLMLKRINVPGYGGGLIKEATYYPAYIEIVAEEIANV